MAVPMEPVFEMDVIRVNPDGTPGEKLWGGIFSRHTAMNMISKISVDPKGRLMIPGMGNPVEMPYMAGIIIGVPIPDRDRPVAQEVPYRKSEVHIKPTTKADEDGS